MTQFITVAAAMFTLLAPGTGTRIANASPALPFKGPAWISIEYPVNPYDATTKEAFLVVHAYHHGAAVEFPVSGTAEGLVGGQRRTVSLEFTKTSRPGVYALKKQWRVDGIWTLVITVTQGTNDVATAVVDLAANGTVASVRVPTRQQGDWMIPQPVAMSDVETSLRARAALLASR